MPICHSPSQVSFARLPTFLNPILLYVQVFGEGTDAVKKSLEGIFDDTVPDGKVKINACFLSKSTASTSALHNAIVSWNAKIKQTRLLKTEVISSLKLCNRSARDGKAFYV